MDQKNEFIVFRDLDNDRISVMYKRRDNKPRADRAEI